MRGERVRRFRRLGLLLAIALVDAAVIYYGVHLHRTPQAPVTGPIIITPVSPAESPTLTKVKLTQSAAGVDSAEATPVPLMAAWSERYAWRSLGYCAQVNNMIGTVKFGSGWYAPSQPAAFVLAMHRTGPTSGWAIGSNATCTSLARFLTTDNGGHWRPAKNVGNFWVTTPVGIRTPSGAVTRPCGEQHPTEISFASAGPAGDAVAICLHRVVRTVDGGKTWQPAGDLSQGTAAAVGLSKNGSGALIMMGEPTCTGGRVLTTSDAGATWAAGPCLRAVKAPVALAIGDGGGGILLALGSRYLTTDFGKTWS